MRRNERSKSRYIILVRSLIVKNLLKYFLLTIMTNLIDYIDRLFFPIALFIVIFSSFYLESYLSNSNSKPLNEKIDRSCELEDFYEAIAHNCHLLAQLDCILEKENYLEQIVKLGNSLNYNFTTSDLYQSIAQYTDNSHSNYICLPLGCWRVSV